MAGKNVPVIIKRKLADLVKTPELKLLLDPKKIEQHRATIQEALFDSIGITLTPKSV